MFLHENKLLLQCSIILFHGTVKKIPFAQFFVIISVLLVVKFALIYAKLQSDTTVHFSAHLSSVIKCTVVCEIRSNLVSMITVPNLN